MSILVNWSLIILYCHARELIYGIVSRCLHYRLGSRILKCLFLLFWLLFRVLFPVALLVLFPVLPPVALTGTTSGCTSGTTSSCSSRYCFRLLFQVLLPVALLGTTSGYTSGCTSGYYFKVKRVYSYAFPLRNKSCLPRTVHFDTFSQKDSSSSPLSPRCESIPKHQ